jgi:hypothetical protein
MIAKMRREIDQLRREVQRLKPVRGPNLLTQQTSRGVTRRPRVGTTQVTQDEGRWA